MKLKLILLIYSLAFEYTLALAQHGVLDNTFGNDGIVITSIGAGDDRCEDIAVQDDGKIVLVGSTFNGTNTDLAVARYNENGALDNTFSEDGDVSVNLGGDEYSNSVVVLTDGKILIAGTQGNSPNSDFLIYKFNGDGTVDMTFGTNGRVTTDFGSTNDVANNIMINSEGKIIVTGEVKNGNDTDFAIAQYSPNGTLDFSFNGNGKATFDIVESDHCYSSVMQPDDKIILFGHITLAGNTNYAVIRCSVFGTLDSSFGANGLVITDLGSENDFGYSAALHKNGKIIVTGLSGNSQQRKLGVVRYLEDGLPDNTFGVNGISLLTIDEYNNANFAAIQTDGKILVAGTSINQNSGDEEITLVRLNSNGNFDNSFGTNGIVNTDIGTGSSSNFSRGIVIQSDLKILVAGTVFFAGSNSDFTLARYISGLNAGVVSFTSKEHGLMIYPNPIQDHALLEYTLIADEMITINLYDNAGNLIKSIVESEIRSIGEHKEKVVLDSSIPSGSYILTLSNGEGSSSVQIIKNERY